MSSLAPSRSRIGQTSAKDSKFAPNIRPEDMLVLFEVARVLAWSRSGRARHLSFAPSAPHHGAELLRIRSREASDEEHRALEGDLEVQPSAHAIRRAQERARLWAPGRRFLRLALFHFADGQVAPTDEEATTLVEAHWRSAFTAQPTDDALQRRILRFLPEHAECAFELSSEALEGPFSRPKWSAPGPDGVRYAAWAALGQRGKHLIMAAARHLGEASEVDVGAFNESRMMLLPKDAAGVDDGAAIEVGRSASAIRPPSAAFGHGRQVDGAYCQWGAFCNCIGGLR